ncbi:MAG: hypothetical protein IJF92_04385 [Bacilli bacterium]|nr:hypothetical protein [Bacilli bacterium]
MREKLKSRKIRVILVGIVMVVITIIGIILLYDDNNSKSISKIDKEDKVINKVDIKEDNNSLDNVEDKGEESATEEVKSEVSNTPKVEEKKETNNKKANTTSSNNTSSNQTPQQTTPTPKQEDVVNNNSNSSSNSNSQAQPVQTNSENTDLYNSITHGQWETDINDSSSQCDAKGRKIANNELNEVLDWNEEHEDNPKQPIINYSRCYPVIKDGITHWYLHFFTTQGEGMDTELKNKYNF